MENTSGATSKATMIKTGFAVIALVVGGILIWINVVGGPETAAPESISVATPPEQPASTPPVGGNVGRIGPTRELAK